MKPVFQIEQGDCVQAMRQMLGDQIDVVVTSPPYNLGKKYGSYDDKKSLPDYLEWTFVWGSEIFRLLRADGSFFLNMGAAVSNPGFPFNVLRVLTGLAGFKLQNTIHWIKAVSVDREEGTKSYGHFNPQATERDPSAGRK